VRRPCPLYLDLISLTLESDLDNQHWLHFPWFRHAGTRRGPAVASAAGIRSVGRAGNAVTIVDVDPRTGSGDDLARLRADAGANRPDRAASDPAQMVLFPADVSGEAELGGEIQHLATKAA
jgi:hypothetical protein